MPNLVGIVLISLVVAVDNALLSGLLLPHTSHEQKYKVLSTVGILLGASQIVLAASVDFLMHSMFFRLGAIFILSWMSIKTLTLFQLKRNTAVGGIVIKTWFYTVFGNLDNMIWLGSELKGDRLWLIVATVATIPLFVAVAVFLSDQSEKQQWILPLGAGMMAWAAASLTLDLPRVKLFVTTLDDAPRATLQCLITVAILLLGFGIRHLIVKRARSI